VQGPPSDAGGDNPPVRRVHILRKPSENFVANPSPIQNSDPDAKQALVGTSDPVPEANRLLRPTVKNRQLLVGKVYSPARLHKPLVSSHIDPSTLMKSLEVPA
jgi:hypothetical protein